MKDLESCVIEWLAVQAMRPNARDEYGEAIRVIASLRRELNDTTVALGKCDQERREYRDRLARLAETPQPGGTENGR
jgi:hypothetical protein